MRLGEGAKMQAAINITPLVDVVLVLLIIFMVMAPQMMRKGPDVDLPNTKKPREQGDERGRILVSVNKAGGLWIAWPKRSSGVETDLTEDTLREVGLPQGLVDNKVCAIDERWSGLRFVIRKENR